MDQLIGEVSGAVPFLQEAFAKGGWLLVLGWLLKLVVSLYSSDNTQYLLGFFNEPRLLWAFWPCWLKRTLVYISSFIAACVTAHCGGMDWGEALLKAGPAAFTAELIYKSGRWSKVSKRITVDIP